MHSMQLRLSAALVAALLGALILLSFQTRDRAEALLLPEVEHKAETVGRSIASLVGRALEVGIPIERLRGLDAYLGRILSANAEFSSIAILKPDGRRLYQAERQDASPDQAEVMTAVGTAEAPQVQIAIGIDPAFARGIVHTLWIDLAIITIVTALVALELVYISFGAGAYGAIEGVESRLSSIHRNDLRQHPATESGANSSGAFGKLAEAIDKRLAAVNGYYTRLHREISERGHAAAHSLSQIKARYQLGEGEAPSALSVIAVRAPLFVFMFAEELTRPFLPLYIKSLASPVPGLSPELVISLPMLAFLAIVALSQPVLGGITERLGRRRSLVWGAAFGVAGYCLSAAVSDLVELTLARSLSAIGFAVVFVAAQGFIIDNTNMHQRTRGMTVFVGAILVAGLCGPPIGGIIADRLGIEVAFLIAGALAGASLLLALLCLPHSAPKAASGPLISAGDFKVVLRSPQLAALFFGCAMPAKMILVAFCFFLVPLHMGGLGYDGAAVGRMLMIYPVITVLLMPSLSSLAQRWNAQIGFVAIGGALAGAGSLLIMINAESLIVLGAILACLGLGQAMSLAPQAALVGQLGAWLKTPASDSALYGVFRFLERTGSALGPVVAGFLLGLYGLSVTMTVIGLVTLAGAVIFMITVSGLRHRTDETSRDMIGGRAA